MNATKVPDGGILYDEAEGDEDDSLPVEADVTRLSGIDWNEAPKNEIVKSVVKLEGGFLIIPDAPGIGIELAPDAAERHPYRPREVRTRLHVDGSVVDQ